MYMARMSVESLWKVGVKRGWWKGIRGGDVLLFVVGWAMCTVVSELEGEGARDQLKGMYIFRLMKGEVDLGLMNEKATERGVEQRR